MATSDNNNVSAFPNLNPFDGLDESTQVTTNAKKRKVESGNTKRNLEKRFKRSGGGKQAHISCNHDHANSFCKANLLTDLSIAENFIRFYDTPYKTQENSGCGGFQTY